MASTPPPLSLRLGRDGLEELDLIARRRGVTRAEAARQAIAAEARALLADPDYVREAREVAALMEALRGSR